MKFQLALDELDLQKAMKQVRQVCDSIDIIELSSRMLMNHGFNIISEFKNRFPNKEVLAYLPFTETVLQDCVSAVKQKADYIVLSACLPESTLLRCIQLAESSGCKVVLDLSDVSADGQPERLSHLEPDYILLGQTPGSIPNSACKTAQFDDVEYDPSCLAISAQAAETYNILQDGRPFQRIVEEALLQETHKVQ